MSCRFMESFEFELLNPYSKIWDESMNASIIELNDIEDGLSRCHLCIAHTRTHTHTYTDVLHAYSMWRVRYTLAYLRVKYGVLTVLLNSL